MCVCVSKNAYNCVILGVSSTCDSEMEVKVDFNVRSGRKCYNLVV